MALHHRTFVMFEVAMECQGDRLRTSDHSTARVEPLNQGNLVSTQLRCSCQTTREESLDDRVVEDTEHHGHW